MKRIRITILCVLFFALGICASLIAQLFLDYPAYKVVSLDELDPRITVEDGIPTEGYIELDEKTAIELVKLYYPLAFINKENVRIAYSDDNSKIYVFAEEIYPKGTFNEDAVQRYTFDCKNGALISNVKFSW